MLRVVSECLPLVRQPPRGRMDGTSALRAPAVRATRKGHTAIKSRRRKHMAAAPAWSEDVSATSTQLGRLRYTYRSSLAKFAPSGKTPADACAQVDNHSWGLPGQVSPTSSEARRDTSDGNQPTDSKATASEGGRPDPVCRPAADPHSCLRQASGATQYIAYSWLWERRSRKPWPRTLIEGSGGGGQGGQGPHGGGTLRG